LDSLDLDREKSYDMKHMAFACFYSKKTVRKSLYEDNTNKRELGWKKLYDPARKTYGSRIKANKNRHF